MGTSIVMRGPPARLGMDPARSRRTGNGDGNQISWGTVGHADKNPLFARIQHNQPMIEVTMQPEGDEIVARLAASGAGKDSGNYIPLELGCRVILAMVDGHPDETAIVGRLWDEQCSMPETVADVSTGTAGMSGQAVGSAPMWQFIKTPSGQLLAIETGSNGDVLIHSGASVHVKVGSGAAVHIEGAVHLGVGPTTAPKGATVGPAGSVLPGIPSTPHIPTPFIPPLPTQEPVYKPFVGSSDSIIRAKDLVQISAATDVVGYTQLTAVFLHPLILLPPPINLTGQHRNALPGAKGSKHTASD